MVERNVGPVLVGGPTSRAVVAAIEALNREATIVDRQGYLRVRVPGRCVAEGPMLMLPPSTAVASPAPTRKAPSCGIARQTK